MMRANAGQAVVISRDEMHGLFSGVLNDTDRDAVTFAARIDGAIARLTGLEILRKTRDDEDSYTISPVITAIMTARSSPNSSSSSNNCSPAERQPRKKPKLTEQFHLSRLQVINWGVFDGYHSIPFSSGGALIAGVSGSGNPHCWMPSRSATCRSTDATSTPPATTPPPDPAPAAAPSTSTSAAPGDNAATAAPAG
ncbi:MAG: hypothetical protein QOI29_1094 [Mycobacterium sp.]|nr:hypothetical protein [Mycobacterium sp.]